MLLLDKSGSMKERVPCASPPCPARIDELRDAMGVFLSESREISPADPRPLGKFGLTLFPTNTECAPADKVQVAFADSDENAALKDRIEEIQDYISKNLHSGSPEVVGGTPTGASLEYLRDYVPEFQNASRKNFVLLLTDGLPNCNDANQQNDCPSLQECLCTSSGICEPKNNCAASLNCLDRDGTLEVIQELSRREIKTIVIGFGVGTGGDSLAREVLNAMAKAGGDMRGCGGNPNCMAYYPADDKTELVEALRKISEKMVPEACVYELSERPSSPALIAVYVNEKRVNPGVDTYAYDEARNAIVFAEDGELCKRLESSSPEAPVHVRVALLRAE
jgi:hypothetical protein